MRYLETENCLDLLKAYSRELLIVKYCFTFDGGGMQYTPVTWSGYWFVNFSKFYLLDMFYKIWLHVTRSETIFMVVFLCEWTKITVIKKNNSCSSGVELASNFVYSNSCEWNRIYIPRIVAAKVMILLSASSKSATVHTSVSASFLDFGMSLVAVAKGSKKLNVWFVVKNIFKQLKWNKI